MYRDRDEVLAYARLGRLPRPPRPAPSRRRWRRDPRPHWPRRVPQQVVPLPAQPLSPHEYLELEFAVGEESRR